MMDIHQILKLLPHRYPILLVDRVLSVDKQRIKAIKNVSINEPQFLGHFPHRPVMPGVMILESMAQAATLLALPIPSSTRRASASSPSQAGAWPGSGMVSSAVSPGITIRRQRSASLAVPEIAL